MTERAISAAEYRKQVDEAKKPRKFRNSPLVVDGRQYDSKAEASYCEGLRLLEKAGKIGGLELQRSFDLVGPNGELICVYRCDAAFFDHEAGRLRVIDVKGGKATQTEAFRIKRRLMKVLLGIDVEIIETGKDRK